MNRKFSLTILPLLALTLLVVVFTNRLADPRATGSIDSPFIGKPVPLELGITEKPPYIINLFASWCAPCAIEHPHLLELQKQGIKIIGIAYKDTPENIANYIKIGGNPYAKIIHDTEGQAGITLGITGVPESFAVSAEGIIRMRLQGPIETPDSARQLATATKTPTAEKTP